MRENGDYTTISLEVESGVLGPLPDKSREAYRRKLAMIRCSFVLNIILACIIIILVALLGAPVRSDRFAGDTADTTSDCVTGVCLLDPCSSNGIFDSLLSKCSCFECYSGADCSVESPASISLSACQAVDVTAGDPRMFEDYWLQSEPSTAAMIKISPVWGLRYHNEEAEDAVKEDIRNLHRLAGNMNIADTDHIVLGVGSTNLLAAVIFSVANRIREANADAEPIDVYAEAPYYPAYRNIATYHRSSLLGTFNPNPRPAPSANTTLIEIITTPNDPTGEDREAMFNESFRLYDRSHSWPHFLPMTGPTASAAGDFDVSVFTLSKITGNAGSRLGWAVVKDLNLAAAIQQYVALSVVSVPQETVWRAHTVLRHVIHTHGAIFTYAKDILEYRWGVVKSLFEKIQTSDRFSLSPTYDTSSTSMCSFFGTEKTLTPAYVWVQCRVAADVAHISRSDTTRVGCDGVFFDAGISGRNGRAFGHSDDSFVRFELLMNERTFDLMHERLLTLLFKVSPL